jgi:hypothetical protein
LMAHCPSFNVPFKEVECESPLEGPHLWVQEMALPRYLSYPVSGGIAGLPVPRGI